MPTFIFFVVFPHLLNIRYQKVPLAANGPTSLTFSDDENRYALYIDEYLSFSRKRKEKLSNEDNDLSLHVRLTSTRASPQNA